jgi:topoisomerase IA-like protein
MTAKELDPKELFARLQDHRLKITRGEEVTDEEIRQGISDLQAYRNGAHTTLESAAKKKGTKAKTATAKAQAKQDAKNLLGDLL